MDSYKKQDFIIDLNYNFMLITSERNEGRKDERNEKDKDRFNRREFSYESFQRTFTLLKDVVDVDKIQEGYENGILRLTVPYKEEAKVKPKRQIRIS